MIADVATPDRVMIAMTGRAGAAEEGLLALAVGVGMQVLHTIMDDDVPAVCGPKWWEWPVNRRAAFGVLVELMMVDVERNR